MGEKWIRAVTKGWLCTHNDQCAKPAVWENERSSHGACAEHAEAMGVPESLRNPKPTRTRIHVGWRVVREREVDGVKVREWAGSLGQWLGFPIYMWPVGEYTRNEVEEYAKNFGGRVCKVFLSYGRGR